MADGRIHISYKDGVIVSNEAVLAALSATNAKWTIYDWQTSAATLVFLVTWLMIAKTWSFMPIGKTAAALLGAVCMVMLGIIPVEEAYAAIDLGTILLLLGLMMILAMLETKGVIPALIHYLLLGNPSPLQLLVRISLASGFMSAFIMNDGAAIFLSAVVVRICGEYDLPIAPYMIAMATSANIGSSSTVMGNPKNMVIHFQAKMDFLAFTYRMGPPAIVGVVLNSALLYCYYYNSLKSDSGRRLIDTAEDSDSDSEDRVDFRKKLIVGVQEANDLKQMNRREVMLSRTYGAMAESKRQKSSDIEEGQPSANFEFDNSQIIKTPLQPLDLANQFPYNADQSQDVNSNDGNKQVRRRTQGEPAGKDVELRVSCSKRELATPTDWITTLHSLIATENVLMGILITTMYALFLLNFDLGWSCLCIAVLLVMVRRKDPTNLYGEVNFPLLLYIIGMFVTIQGINATPVAGYFWTLVHPLLTPGSPVAVAVFGFSSLVLLLCLVFTSIPCVLLVSPHLLELNEGPLASYSWLLLSWSVTLCGNLTIFSSVAGVIASEKAAMLSPISFMDWFRYAFPSTCLILAIGAALIVAGA